MAESRPPGRTALELRILSALAMIPPALGAVWFGWPWLPLLVAVGGAVTAWEWGRLAGDGRPRARATIMVGAALAAIAAAAVGAFVEACGLATLGAIAAALAASRERIWAGVGASWIIAGAIAFLWLATPRGGGRAMLLWLLAVVWATDILAYAAGKWIGGWKLAPRLSPNKTWAGFAGGLVGAAGVGAATAAIVGARAAALVALSVAIGLAAHGGDLAESLAKRHFGVKDASGLIPGHGGLLDRLDGLIAAAIAAALFALAVGERPWLNF
jgi:phosphatidate cytidylyltransferase